MRTVLMTAAVVGTLLAVGGLLLSVNWLVLAGTAIVVVAMVTGALAAPTMRRDR